MRSTPLLVLALLLVALPTAAPASADEEAPERAALRVLDAFMAAFNARDEDAWAATLHYPHVRIAGGRVTVARDASAFTRSFDFERFAAATGWDHSAWTERRVVQAGPDKVHVAVRFTRYRKDGSELSSFESLYVVTRRDGRWGVQARSSFAP